MNKTIRILITIFLAFLTVVVGPIYLALLLTNANSLIWQFSYWMPAWLAGPLALVLILLLVLLPLAVIGVLLYSLWRPKP